MKTAGAIIRQGTYQEQIQSEHWEAFSAHARECQPYCTYCKRSDVKLTVHHIFYDWNRKLWEYAPDEVIVLCQDCHDQMSKALTDFRKYVFGKLNAQSFRVLNGALAVAMREYDPLTFCHALAEIVCNRRLIENHAAAWSEQPKSGEPQGDTAQ